MQLRTIDKNAYSKRYKLVFAGIVAAMVILSLGSSAIMIQLLGNSEGSNFKLNLIGVIFAGVVVSFVIYRMRNHPFMDEVVYVWNLKQNLNRIYRKQRKIEPLIDDNDVDAMVIMNYMYEGSKQLYQLDDNTITMDQLSIKISHLNAKLEETGLTVSTDQYDPSMLDQF
jgi:4-amino-4-deoxy-L-arabinose transferase-like glycosyltransferase